MNKVWLEEEMIKIAALNISWYKKFKLRVLAGKASVNPMFEAQYYLTFNEYEEE